MLLIGLSLLAIATVLGILEWRQIRREKRERDSVSFKWLQEYWRNPK